MASIYRRKRSRFWWIKVHAPGGVVLRFSSQTEHADVAQAHADEIARTFARSARLWAIEREETAARTWLARWRSKFNGKIPRDVLDCLLSVKVFRRKLQTERVKQEGTNG